MALKLRTHIALLSMILTTSSALATDGYFSHGYGTKAKGMGGASTAVSQDAFGGANNPATLLWAGNQLEIGVDAFMPDRKTDYYPMPGYTITADSESDIFYIPEFAYNKIISKDLSLGVTAYGNGGMNTDYQAQADLLYPGVNNILYGSTDLGVDLVQVIVAPSLAKAINDDHVFGVSILLVGQRFEAQGLQAFAMLSSDPSNLTNNGDDYAFGVGLRLGYIGRINQYLSVGASYAPQIKMSEFDDYAGLFAEQGRFDIPENYNLGIALTPNEDWLIALDYQHINYSDVKSVGNSSDISTGIPLGEDNAPGFGWKSIDVYKVGVQYTINTQWTVRAGYNHSDNPVGSEDVTFNILAPGVIEKHYTAGFTYTDSNKDEWSLYAMYAPSNKVTGNRPVAFGPNQADTIEMSQTSLGLQYSHSF